MFGPKISPKLNPLTRSAVCGMVGGDFQSGDGCRRESLGEFSGYCFFWRRVGVVCSTISGIVDTH